MLGSNCLTLSFSCRNTNLYLYTLKYSAAENEDWDRTQNRVVMDPWQLFSSQVFSPLHGKEDLTITAVGNPENSKDKLPTGKEQRSQLWGKVVSLTPCAA